jgi:isocitrate dehydrogenase
MLNHIGQAEIAEKIQNAWLRTIEEGIHTYDIFKDNVSTQKVGTREFADAVIARLGQKPEKLQSVTYNTREAFVLPQYQRKAPANKELVGVDVFVHWNGLDANALAQKVHQLDTEGVKLSMITNRGVKVYPDGFPETFCTDHWRCRFKPVDERALTKEEIISLLSRAHSLGIDTIKTENLYAFDGKPAYSLGQGQ